ncbi:hypothetical protein H5410_053722 [Solanum commersonii]|uniref:Uncharacterized protein n=1 Tax=Solanum commersonii TaxID=4109 RepID=A0A9J5X5P4_SOLCO|nr:hypothetical protein H5410_053722 [Solanum commersonii]
MADTLPKKSKDFASKFQYGRRNNYLRKKLRRLYTKKSYEKLPEPDPADSDPEDTESESDENNLSIDQFTRHYDPIEDNDSE